MAVVYDENHGYVENYYLKRSPALVLIDSQIIANAPERFLVAGIGDAYATYYEAEICVRTNAKNYGGGASTQAAIELARLCHKTLLDNADLALIACREHMVIPVSYTHLDVYKRQRYYILLWRLWQALRAAHCGGCWRDS